jgi:hypothetical protein
VATFHITQICIGLGNGHLVLAPLAVEVVVASEISVLLAFILVRVFVGGDNRDPTIVERI